MDTGKCTIGSVGWEAPRGERVAGWLDALIIAAVGFTAHYALASRFGLYQDDFVYVGQPMGWSWTDAAAALRSCFLDLPEGRPLGFALGRLVPFLCFRAGGGLLLVYWCGAAWVIGNALLVRTLLSRPCGRTFGLLGALAFTLFPADTTHALLTHALALQPALTFLLAALLCHVRGRTVTSFALAACALLTYESAVLPFALATLLAGPWDRRLVGRTIGHATAVLGLVGAVLVLRILVGEGRVREAQGFWTSLPAMTLRSVTLGPSVSLTSFTRRSAAGLGVLAGSGAMLVAAAALTAVLAVRLRGKTDDVPLGTVVRALLAGVALTAVSYCFAFPPHYPPVAWAGLMTSVHLAASLGAAMVWAAALSLPLRVAGRPALRTVAAALASGFLASLWAFDVTIQQGMARAAEQQRRMWSELVRLVPDLPPGAVVLALGPKDPEASSYVASSSWGDTLALPLLFTPAPGDPPVSFVRIEKGPAGLDDVLLEAGGRLRWGPGLPGDVVVDRAAALDSRTLAVLERAGTRWIRRTGTLEAHGVSLPLQVPLPAAPRPLRRGPLHGPLLGHGVDPARGPRARRAPAFRPSARRSTPPDSRSGAVGSLVCSAGASRRESR